MAFAAAPWFLPALTAAGTIYSGVQSVNQANQAASAQAQSQAQATQAMQQTQGAQQQAATAQQPLINTQVALANQALQNANMYQPLEQALVQMFSMIPQFGNPLYGGMGGTGYTGPTQTSGPPRTPPRLAEETTGPLTQIGTVNPRNQASMSGGLLPSLLQYAFNLLNNPTTLNSMGAGGGIPALTAYAGDLLNKPYTMPMGITSRLLEGIDADLRNATTEVQANAASRGLAGSGAEQGELRKLAEAGLTAKQKGRQDVATQEALLTAERQREGAGYLPLIQNMAAQQIQLQNQQTQQGAQLMQALLGAFGNVATGGRPFAQSAGNILSGLTNLYGQAGSSAASMVPYIIQSAQNPYAMLMQQQGGQGLGNAINSLINILPNLITTLNPPIPEAIA